MKLERCKLCGGEAVLEPASEYGFAYVICGKCLRKTPVNSFLKDQEAIDFWNNENAGPKQETFGFVQKGI